MKHHCHAAECDVAVPPKLLFCLKHWKLLPKEWQKLIWLTYKPGQEITKTPSAQYLLVQSISVAIVACAEKVWTAAQGTEHIKRTCDLVWNRLDRGFVENFPEIPLEN